MLKRSSILGFLLILFLCYPSSTYAATTPSGITLEAPQILCVNVQSYSDGTPYFQLKWSNPQSAEQINAQESSSAPLAYQIDFRVGNAKWNYETEGDLIHTNSLHDGDNLVSSAYWGPNVSSDMEAIDINHNTYSFRVRYSYEYDDGNTNQYLYSPFSNVATAGLQALSYQGASQWAVPQLDKAMQYGLITEKIKSNMNAPISREEFAELAVKLYEKSTGRSASYSDMSVFTDTKNPEIFKANSLGIVSGTDKEKRLFSPGELTNREQVAVMLYCAIKAMGKSTSEPSIVKIFNDASEISSFALEPVVYMNSHGYISGSGGNFDPKGTCTREMAVAIATQVYERSAGKTTTSSPGSTNPNNAPNQNTPPAGNMPLPGGNGNNGDNPNPQNPNVDSNIFPLVSDALIHYVDEWDDGDGTVMYTSNLSITKLVEFYTDSGLYNNCQSIVPIPAGEGGQQYMVTTSTLDYFIYIGPNLDPDHGKQNVVQMCVYSNGGITGN